jgi:eukaryotic-like serine/threonine-protein kinase
MSGDELKNPAGAAAGQSSPGGARTPQNDQTQIGSDTSSAPINPSSSSVQRSPEILLGRMLGRYRLISVLGVGAMGVVYRAHDSQIERDVAIKILPDELAADQNMLSRFLGEAKAAGQLAHPNVVAIYEIGQQGNTHYLVLELAAGGNIGDWITAHGPLPVRQATQILADACQGVAAAHAAGMIHRDLKPTNLLRSHDGTVKVADFGLAKQTVEGASHFTQAGQVIGTPYYMSPEQCESKPVDHRSDIYSLGGTYYTLLTGISPYHDAGSTVQVMYAHCHGQLLDPRHMNPTIPDACAAIIARATAKNPKDRYQSVTEMRADLTAVLEGDDEDRSSKLQTRISEPVSRRRNRPWLVASILLPLIVVACLSGGWFAFHSKDRASNENTAIRRPEQVAAAAAALARGVTHDTISFGTTTAYSGSNRDVGMNMVIGIRTCFEAVNDQEGIHGRQLKLTVLDDGYEPDRAIVNTRDLFEKRGTFAMIGNVGSATALVTVPYAIEHHDLLFAPATGASFLRRDPPDRYVFNYRASYADETAAMVNYFVEVKRVPPNQIAVFLQDDAYGEDGFQGVARALRRYHIREENILRTTYKRNTLQVAGAVDQIQKHRDSVRAIVMVPITGPAALFIKELKDRKIDALLGAVSFVGDTLGDRLREMGPHYGAGLVVTQVVPHYQSAATGVIRYRDLLAKYFPESRPGFISLEGFIAAECLVEGLRKAGPELNTERLIDALESIRDLDLGIGPIVSFGPSRHQASHKVWGTVLDESRNFQNLDLEQP